MKSQRYVEADEYLAQAVNKIQQNIAEEIKARREFLWKKFLDKKENTNVSAGQS